VVVIHQTVEGCLRPRTPKKCKVTLNLGGADMTNDVGGPPDAYMASLQGKEIECVSLQDATSMRIADALLSGASGYEDFTPSDLERLAAVLFRYGRDNAANRLNSRAARMRAAYLLSGKR
jgi:hypothetical protein